jgi:hypothetical protein
MAFVFAIPQFSRGSAFYVRPLDPSSFMNEIIDVEIRNLERKLRKELSTYLQPIPIASIAQETKKTHEEAERDVIAIRKVVRGSPIVIIHDETGQKCAGIKVSPQKVSFRKPQ